MSATLVLVRHGETAWNAEGRLQGQTDIPLNQMGRLQARNVGAELAASEWDLLVSSPLGRAVETAKLVGRGIGLELAERIPDLMERHYGRGEGRVVQGMARPQIDAILESAEPETEVAARGVRALARLAGEHPGANMVVVAHGTLLRLTLEAVLGRPHPRLSNGQAVLLDVAALEGMQDGELAARP